jgi:TetR/AcrR family transcriptional regulator
MQVTSGLSAENAKVIEAYWRLVDETVFGKYARAQAAPAQRSK